MLRAMILIGSITMAGAAHADGPFGISPGTPLENLTIKHEVSSSRFVIDVPNTHPEFESYVVTATSNAGVCSVTGIGKDYDNDRFGLSVQDAFDNLRGQLERRYGKGEEITFIRRGALWDASNEWVMSIRQNERAHQMSWEGVDTTVSGFKNDDILLTVGATSSDSAYLTLQYRFSNMEACRAELNQAAEDAL